MGTVSKMSTSELRHIVWEQIWFDIFFSSSTGLAQTGYIHQDGAPNLRALWDIAFGALFNISGIFFHNVSGPFKQKSPTVLWEPARILRVY